MNKYIIFFALVSTLVAYAQDDEMATAIKSPEVEMASETVAVPDIIDPLEEYPIENGVSDSADTSVTNENEYIDNSIAAPTEEEVPSVPDDAVVEAPEYEEAPILEKDNAPEVVDTTEEISAPVTAATGASPTPLISTEIKNDEDFSIYKGHWTTLFNFETLNYPTPFQYNNKPNGNTTQKKTKNIDEPDLAMYGGRIGFGREFYLGLGFMTTSRIEAYYMGSLFSKEKSANPDANATINTSKTFGSIYGVDASQSLGWVFDLKTKNPFMDEMTYLAIEPFIEAGIGIGQAVAKTTFTYQKTSGLDEYSHKFSDTLANARIGAGVNMTSRTGYYFFLRATVNRYEVVSRDQKVRGSVDGQSIAKANLPDDQDKLNDPIVIYAIGGGYKF